MEPRMYLFVAYLVIAILCGVVWVAVGFKAAIISALALVIVVTLLYVVFYQRMEEFIFQLYHPEDL